MPALRRNISEVNTSEEWFAQGWSIPIKLISALVGADVSGLPKFDDAYAKLWPRIPVPTGERLKSAAHRVIGKGFNNCVKPNPSMPCCTLPKTQTGRGFATIAHWAEQRALSIGEAKRIGSFPDGWQTIGDYSTQWMRIGNSVPPLLMRSIAGNIRSMLQTGQPIRTNGRLQKIDDYPALLESCWQEHLAPRAEDAPTVISTFAGAGGSSLGYSMAGFRELLAVEWDDNAVATFKLNFPDVPVYHGDIAKLSVEDMLHRTGLQPGQLDVFDGSPPCQGFSTAGKRDFNDDRNQLFREYVRLLRGLQPKVFVMENVSGMVKGKMKLIFADILRELKASGYQVSARLLNAMYFGVPQSRERMIFIGVREDLGIAPSHPKAESKPVTVGSAWAGGKAEQHGDELKGPALMIAPFVPAGDNNGGGKYSKRVRGTTSGFGFSRLSFDKVSCTLPKLSLLSSSPIVHPIFHERISIEQAKRIASFDDKFQMIGTFEEQWARIGNSVPPIFMRSIARHIRSEILG